jgi:hypothetical protein
MASKLDGVFARNQQSLKSDFHENVAFTLSLKLGMHLIPDLTCRIFGRIPDS